MPESVFEPRGALDGGADGWGHIVYHRDAETNSV